MNEQKEKQIRLEYDYLKGNVNRMFLTDDVKELEYMFKVARERLQDIYEYHKNRLRK